MTQSKPGNRPEKGFVLVTGASSGIGAAIATHLAKNGYGVFTGTRSDSAEAQVRESIKASGVSMDHIVPVRLDVTKPEQITSAIETIQTYLIANGANSKLVGLVNNAGVAVAGPVELLAMERLRSQFDVNFFGLVALTQASLPLLRESKGRIVNISSISGRVAVPGLGAYSSSKFAVEALSDALRRELIPQGIHVALVEPGPIQTPIWEKSKGEASGLEASMTDEEKRLYGDLIKELKKSVEEAEASALPPLRVAEAVCHALTAPKPKSRYPIGMAVQTASVLAGVLPDSVLDKMITKNMMRSRRI